MDTPGKNTHLFGTSTRDGCRKTGVTFGPQRAPKYWVFRLFLGIFDLKVLISIKNNSTCKNKTNSCLQFGCFFWMVSYHVVHNIHGSTYGTIPCSNPRLVNSIKIQKKIPVNHWVYYNPSSNHNPWSFEVSTWGMFHGRKCAMANMNPYRENISWKLWIS